MVITKKRNLFKEIKQGILEAKAHKAKKIILRTHRLIKDKIGCNGKKTS